jgi:hypothetical protein
MAGICDLSHNEPLDERLTPRFSDRTTEGLTLPIATCFRACKSVTRADHRRGRC